MSDDADDGDGWADYESGPFCRHWSYPADCERPCARCGCPCSAHWSGEKCRQCEACDGFEGSEDE